MSTPVAPPKPVAPAKQGDLTWLRSGVLLTLLPLVLCALLLLVVLRFESRRALHERLEQGAASLSLLVEGEISEIVATLASLATSRALETGDLVAARAEMQRAISRHPAWYTLMLTDGQRQIINLRYLPDEPMPPVTDAPAVGRVLTTALPQAGDLSQGRFAVRVAVWVDGAVRLVLAARVETSLLSGVLGSPALPAGWSAVLLDGERRRLAGHGPMPEEVLRLALPEPGTVTTLPLLSGGGGAALAVPVSNTRWTLILGAPLAMASGLPAQFGWALAAGVVLTLLLTGLLALRLIRRWQAEQAERDRRHRAELERAEAAENRLSELLTTVGEEVRAPLTVLLSQTERLSRLDLVEMARDAVQQQRRAGQALLALMDDALDYTRLEGGVLGLESADLDLHALLDDCARMVRPTAERKGLALTLTLDAGLPRWMQSDPLRLRQVVLNLLDNGIAATGSGRVTLDARLIAHPERVAISVTDGGPAIPEAELPRVFDSVASPHGQSRAASPGIRLGLAISRRLVAVMQGEIRAENLAEGGTRFTFTIPFRPGAPPALAPGQTRSLRVLAAEDVPASRMLLQAVLERAGHAVTAVEDGPRALAALHSSRFDLMLLDLNMPGLGGFDVVAALRALPDERSRLPVIALTADAADEVEAACQEAGFDAVVQKPFESKRLLGLIDSLRSRDLPVSEPPPRRAAAD